MRRLSPPSVTEKIVGHARQARSVLSGMSTFTEIVAYRIQRAQLERFDTIKNALIAEARAIPGLLSSTTSVSLEDETLFVDTMVWESPVAAQEGRKTFEGLPTTPEFLSMMAGSPLFAGLVRQIAPS